MDDEDDVDIVETQPPRRRGRRKAAAKEQSDEENAEEIEFLREQPASKAIRLDPESDSAGLSAATATVPLTRQGSSLAAHAAPSAPPFGRKASQRTHLS